MVIFQKDDVREREERRILESARTKLAGYKV